ncbi:hypothetical protein MC885_001224 [Smutsia gigantea]|nr:hypothetical protein MC885_001224 [Smutsia gigantea]
MNLVYSGIPEYEGVNITRLSRGSVVVEHEVLLKAKYTPEYNEVFNEVTQKVEQKIMNVTKEQISVNDICECKFLSFWEELEEIFKESLSFVIPGWEGEKSRFRGGPENTESRGIRPEACCSDWQLPAEALEGGDRTGGPQAKSCSVPESTGK